MRYAPMLTALVAASAVSLSAQSPAPASTPIRVGQSVSGRLAQSDPKFSDGSLYRLYTFAGNKGEPIALDLTSDDFDANLLIADASGNTLARNDDGGGACNARLTFVPPATGNYRVYANSSAQAELGDYRLTLARGRATVAADTVCRGFGRVAGLITVGQTINGELSSDDPEFSGDSTYFERWILPVRAKQAFTIDLQSSDFDAYALLTRGRGDKLVENDDGGGGCNARIVYTAPDDHPLRIIVNSASRPRRQTGHFVLRVTEGESATEPKSNCRLAAGAAEVGAGAGAAASTALIRQASNTNTAESLDARPIEVGQTREGTLSRHDVLLNSDSTYAQPWVIEGHAGQTITIDLESDDFDAYLFLRRPGVLTGRDFQDDDSGGNCNARLTATFPQDGAYEIDVNTTDHYATGSFTLSVTSGSKPKSVARCNRSSR